MNTTLTDADVRHLAEKLRPYSLGLLSWAPGRIQDGADDIERAHQRRILSLRADGTIAVLCPVGSETLAGVAIMTVPPDQARAILADDPCVRAGMMTCEVHPCNGFPGDALP